MSKIIIVPVSGGKDSQVVLSLCLREGFHPVCVHQNTGYDHPDTYQQLTDMETFYKVRINHTVSKYGDMFGYLEHAQYFPNSAARGCTQRLKQEPFQAWLWEEGYREDNCEIWFGMRIDESKSRGEKYSGLEGDDLFTLGDIASFYSKGPKKELGLIPCRLPIVDWDQSQVFNYLCREGSPINPLYRRGHHRVGCYPCLLSRKGEWIAASYDPTGQERLKKLKALQDRWASDGNPRKFIKVHRRWDVQAFIDQEFDQIEDDPMSGCAYCSI